MFVLKKNPTFEKQIISHVPNEKSGTEAFKKITFKVTFRLPATDELFGVTEEVTKTTTLLDAAGVSYEKETTEVEIVEKGLQHKPMKEVLLAVVTDFSELLDEENKPLEFSEENLKLLIAQYPVVAVDITQEFWKAVNGKDSQKAKN